MPTCLGVCGILGWKKVCIPRKRHPNTSTPRSGTYAPQFWDIWNNTEISSETLATLTIFNLVQLMDGDSLSQTLNVWNMLPTFGQFSWYMQANTLQQTNIAGWKMDPLKMYVLSEMEIFHCYVSLWEGISWLNLWVCCHFSHGSIRPCNRMVSHFNMPAMSCSWILNCKKLSGASRYVVPENY